MNDELNAIPPARRRRMALMLAPVGVVLLVAGALAVSLDGVGWKLAGLLVAALAVVLLGVAWGLRRSAALSEALAEATAAEQRLDEVLVAAAQSSGLACDGGVERADGVERSRIERAHDAESSACDPAGLVCGVAGAPGGCGGSCLARTR